MSEFRLIWELDSNALSLLVEILALAEVWAVWAQSCFCRRRRRRHEVTNGDEVIKLFLHYTLFLFL